MHISPKDYFRIVPSPLRAGLEPGQTIKCLQNIYCPAMLKQNKCTTNCDLCTTYICKIMEEVKNFPNPRNIYACMTYIIRDNTSKIADTTEVVTVKERRDWLGQKIESNPFELALKEL